MSSSAQSRAPRKFLVVIDKTPECKVALRFAARRAQHTGGRVTLMCPATPPDFQQWRGVEEIMRDEAHAESEAMLFEASKLVNDVGGIIPESDGKALKEMGVAAVYTPKDFGLTEIVDGFVDVIRRANDLD